MVGNAITKGEGGLSDALFKRGDQIRAEELHYSTQRIGTLVDADATDYHAQSMEKKGTDAYDSMKAVDDWMVKATDAYISPEMDEKLRLNVSQHIQAKGVVLKNSLAAHEAGQRDLVAEDTRIGTLASASKSAYQGFGTLDDNLKIVTSAIINDPRLRDTDRENKLMVAQSTVADSYLDGMVNRNPLAALEIIKSGTFNQYLTKERLQEFDVKIKPKLDAYTVDGILNSPEISKLFPKSVDDAFERDTIYQAVKAKETDPNIIKLVHAELVRLDTDHKSAQAERFDQASGSINLNGSDYWTNNKVAPMSVLTTSEEYSNMSDSQKIKVTDKWMAENWRIYSHQQTIGLEARRIENDSRRQEKDDIRADHQATVLDQTKTANYYEAHPEELLQMTQSRFEGFATEVSNTDYNRFAAQRQKLNDPAKMSHAVIAADTKTRLLDQAGITDPDEVKKYGAMVNRYVDNVQRQEKRYLEPKEIESAVVQGLQNVAVNERTSRLGINTGYETTTKKRMEVKNPAAIIIPVNVQSQFDDLEIKRGVKLTPDRRRMLYDELLKEEK
jgi:hypothetical protein